ncbi:hypothetical protein BDA96_02G211800 [Sorghum bicolor]|uniref:Uncharacterized protein n=1 Tax=Sorghum bicolor TaxID=4558 RepID=A0A921RNE9_SORBI|nr:hypothetical protein BDA96_02G211800 [Sorghum bicolor]
MELAHAATRSSQLIAELAHRHTSRFTCAARGGWGRARLASSHLAATGEDAEAARAWLPRLMPPQLIFFLILFDSSSLDIGIAGMLGTKGIWYDDSTPSSAKRAHGIRVSSSRRDKAVQRF